jgi:hypothetical protein
MLYKGRRLCTVHRVRGEGECVGGSEGLGEEGGAAARLRGGATAWTYARVGQRRRGGRQDDGWSSASRSTERLDAAPTVACKGVARVGLGAHL